MAPSDHVAALRGILGELFLKKDALRFITDLLQGVDSHYEMGIDDAPPLVGRWLPELTIETKAGKRRLPELMHGARGVLVDLTGRAELANVASPWLERVDVVVGRAEGKTAPADALLIRPDGHVAWVAVERKNERENQHDLETALTRWFGSITT